MKSFKSFQSFHPVVTLCYFLSIIFVTMFTMHPVIIFCSLIGSVVFTGMLIGIKQLLKSLMLSFPMMLIMALTNPLFVHKGETILFFLNDNPVTKEAILYGVNISFMIISVFYWFKCYNEIMTSDKFIYLFGKVIPKISLLLSMVINYVPKLKHRWCEIDDAQTALGYYSQRGVVNKIRSKIRVLGILITWSLENSVEKANSMRARGYGLKGRTSYSMFSFTIRDGFMMIVITLLTFMVCWFLGIGYGNFNFYPVINKLDWSVSSIILYSTWLILAFTAFISEVKESLSWRYLKSKI